MPPVERAGPHRRCRQPLAETAGAPWRLRGSCHRFIPRRHWPRASGAHKPWPVNPHDHRLFRTARPAPCAGRALCSDAGGRCARKPAWGGPPASLLRRAAGTRSRRRGNSPPWAVVDPRRAAVPFPLDARSGLRAVPRKLLVASPKAASRSRSGVRRRGENICWGAALTGPEHSTSADAAAPCKCIIRAVTLRTSLLPTLLRWRRARTNGTTHPWAPAACGAADAHRRRGLRDHRRACRVPWPAFAARSAAVVPTCWPQQHRKRAGTGPVQRPPSTARLSRLNATRHPAWTGRGAAVKTRKTTGSKPPCPAPSPTSRTCAG